MEKINIKSMRDVDYKDKTVLLRLDINSPIDPETHEIVNENRLKKSVPTVEYLLDSGAKVAIIAHQGDTLDYQNLISMAEHAEILSRLMDRRIDYIDDVCGPAAIKAVQELKSGEAIILGNLRYLTEEISHFEKVVKLTPEEMTSCWLVRKLAPIVDCYVNDAFSAAHRAAPSMVAFQEVLPSAAGDLLFTEYKTLSQVQENPAHPSVFVLGGAKISDAFGMMEQVLVKGTADRILTTGVTGAIFLLASGQKIGKQYEDWLDSKQFLVFVDDAKRYLEEFGDRIEMPRDLAYAVDGVRYEMPISELPKDDVSFLDIGEQTQKDYREIILEAKTLFANGPAGVYEDELFENGTRACWQAIADSEGFSVIGGGDTVSSAAKYIDLENISYVCTAGGAMVQFMTGNTLPLIKAMIKACSKEEQN
ncbi:MAG TPA: phosphoglycerate kinase [Clostridiaceae bacterium]|nr:phosphoglycerate kinase [Clostridiaceae bacterium]